jgi:hypothetical protein
MSVLQIGVLTFHRCINYGSYWQARCLVEGLRARGHHAVILDHDSRRINIAEWKCAFRPMLPTAVLKADYPLYREKMRHFFHAFEALPRSPRFPLDHPATMEPCDLVVVGSDEVWNLCHPWYGQCPLFYGDGVRAQRLIAYAASFGNYEACWGLEQPWVDRLRHFAMISVRDANSQRLVTNALGVEPALVLDPCLQFALEPEERHGVDERAPYVAVYGHSFSVSFAREIRRWAHHRNRPLISIGYRNAWADAQWITADPHDFAHFMAHADAVATNFFHGCVFALHHVKPFVCETSPYRRQKLQGLMATIGGETYLLTAATPSAVYDAHLGAPLEPAMLQKLDRLRHTSQAYLNQALVFDKGHPHA